MFSYFKFLFFSLDGELICKRRFCLNCLKLNYEYKHETHSKTDWVCPFCQVSALFRTPKTIILGVSVIFLICKK